MNFRMSSASAFSWIAAILLGTIGWLVNKVLSVFIPSGEKESTPRLDEVSEGCADIPGCVGHSDLPEDNISRRFEIMCVEEPIKYRSHPKLQQVIADYRRLLRGEIPDPDGQHVPSEELNGKDNPDYVAYLKAQKKILKDASWVSKEIRRVSNIDNGYLALGDIMQTGIRMGVPVEIAMCLMSKDRAETYTAEQWRDLFVSVKGYVEHIDRYPNLTEFLYAVQEHQYVTSADCLEMFCICRKSGVLVATAARIAKGEVSPYQADLAWKRIEEDEDLEFEDALEQVVSEGLHEDSEEELRQSYRAQLRKG